MELAFCQGTPPVPACALLTARPWSPGASNVFCSGRGVLGSHAAHNTDAGHTMWTSNHSILSTLPRSFQGGQPQPRLPYVSSITHCCNPSMLCGQTHGKNSTCPLPLWVSRSGRGTQGQFCRCSLGTHFPLSPFITLLSANLSHPHSQSSTWSAH